MKVIFDNIDCCRMMEENIKNIKFYKTLHLHVNMLIVSLK
jgi:hypothetical protein